MKVADLKAILQQANVAFDAKLTKPALIKKIMETPEALSAAGEENGDDDLVRRRTVTSCCRLTYVSTARSSSSVSQRCLLRRAVTDLLQCSVRGAESDNK